MKKYLFILSLFVLQLNAQDQTINGTTFKQDGKVGIGTTNPYSLLDIRTSDNKGLRLNANDESAISFWPNNGNSVFHLSHGHDNKLHVSQGSTVGAAKLMTFVNSGNIGIGTTTPTDKLEVAGNLRINGPNTDDEIRFESQNGFHRIAFRQLRFYDWDAGGDNLTINNGNVGIGTTTPSQKLSIQGDNNSVSVSQASYNYSSSIPIGAQFGVWDGSFTNAAGTKFHRYRGSANSFTNGYIGQAYADGEWGLDFRVENQTSVSNATQSRMFIKPNGNIGIGTTDTKGFKLGVDGKIAATEVKIATYANWSDFVFENEYNLPTLKEVEQHIKEKGHLKDIPSAEEVEKDGFFLGDMNSKLLQKIEELTLYTIDQQKEIEELNSLKEENQLLRKKFDALEALVSKIIKNNKN